MLHILVDLPRRKSLSTLGNKSSLCRRVAPNAVQVKYSSPPGRKDDHRDSVFAKRHLLALIILSVTYYFIIVGH